MRKFSNFQDKLEYLCPEASEGSCPSNCSDNMVETKSFTMRNRSESGCSNLSSSPNMSSYLGSDMLINSQNLSFFDQHFKNNSIISENTNSFFDYQKQSQIKANSPTKSLFTIDSILGTNRPKLPESPCSSPNNDSVFKTNSEQFIPILPIRVPTTILHHSGIHLSQLARFGSPSDFIGEFFLSNCSESFFKEP